MQSNIDHKTIGYARSASAANLAEQISALEAAGCGQIFTDNGVGGLTLDRPGLSEAKAVLRRGDTLKVCDPTRIARSLGAHAEFSAWLQAAGVKCVSLSSPSAEAARLDKRWLRKAMVRMYARFLLFLNR